VPHEAAGIGHVSSHSFRHTGTNGLFLSRRERPVWKSTTIVKLSFDYYEISLHRHLLRRRHHHSQRLLDIGDQVVHILDANGKANELIGHPHFLPLLG
jgi:hypothetical protein